MNIRFHNLDIIKILHLTAAHSRNREPLYVFSPPIYLSLTYLSLSAKAQSMSSICGGWHDRMGNMTATAKATLHTNHGDIVVNLFGNHAPLTVKNFIGLSDGTQEWRHPRTGEVENGPLYKDVVFHRIIRDFMIQGGDPLGQGIGGPGYQFKDEIHPELSFNKPYLLAMANAGPGTNVSHFFITTVETPWLNGRHTIFGEVVGEDSKKVVDAIEGVATGAMDRPVEDVVISSIDIEEL